MLPLIKWLNEFGWYTVASCCGHGKYPMTVVIRSCWNNELHFKELLSNTKIPRSRRFYERDKEGYYFIPEISNVKK